MATFETFVYSQRPGGHYGAEGESDFGDLTSKGVLRTICDNKSPLPLVADVALERVLVILKLLEEVIRKIVV